MTAENSRRLVLLNRQLNEHLMSAALCQKEIDAIALAEANHHDSGNGQARRPSPSDNGMRRHCGSWLEAMRAAGLDPDAYIVTPAVRAAARAAARSHQQVAVMSRAQASFET